MQRLFALVARRSVPGEKKAVFGLRPNESINVLLRRFIMSEKLCFLMCFVLVLSLGGFAQAGAIDVNNGSFEYDCNGNQIQREVPPDFGCIKGWTNSGNYFGAIIWCESPLWDTVSKCNVVCPTDGHGIGWIQNNDIYCWQVIDSNNYAANKRYTLLIDGQGNCNPDISLFYGADPCDANKVISKVFSLATGEPYACENWVYDLKVEGDVLTGSPAVGQPIGIKIYNPASGGGYFYMDNVRLEEDWATNAYEPYPADGAEEVNRVVTLTWKSGTYTQDVNGHEVYFGTSWAEVDSATTATVGIYRGAQNRDANSYTPTEVTLELGKTYFWRIDEVNESYSGTEPPPGPWKGDVWSFTVTGYAYNVYPADGAVDIPFLGLLLRWTAGTDADGHDVYFGSDEAAVESADTSTPVIYRGPTQALSDVNYAVEDLDVSKTYFWRIDEVNTATVKGDVWSFTTGTFLVVDDYESYGNQTDLWNVWDDYWVNGSDGEMFLENDVNIIRESGSQAAMLKFENITKGYPGSVFDVQDMTELDIGSDWTVGGVKALFMYVRGDPCNAQAVDDGKGTPLWEAATPWIELEDTSSNTGYVLHPNPSLMGEDSWNEWNIDLGIFDACGVTLSAIDRFTIGIGGADKTGQSKAMAGAGYMYVDDIRVYPPRCRPEVLTLTGDFTGDCNVNYDDLDIMAADWMKIDGDVWTENRPATLANFVGDPNWTTGYIGGALEVNNTDGQDTIDVIDPRLKGLTNMTITAWVKRYGSQDKYCAIVASREKPPGGATELLGDRNATGEIAYGWNGMYWSWSTGLELPDQTWTFIAMAVEPTQATVYMHPAGGSMSKATNVDDHPPLIHFAEQFRIGRSLPDGKRFEGLLDDIRIYAWTLTEPNMEQLVHQTGEPNAWPVYWYKFDDGAGLVAADSGFGTQVYSENTLVTNLVPKDPNDSEDPNLGSGALDPNNLDIINFLDYAIFADNWMEQLLWPSW